MVGQRKDFDGLCEGLVCGCQKGLASSRGAGS